MKKRDFPPIHPGAILVAESDLTHKDTMICLVMNMLVSDDNEGKCQ